MLRAVQKYYSTKKKKIPYHDVSTLRMSCEWIYYGGWDDMRQRGAVCSTLLHPPVSAGKVDVPSLFSHAVFVVTKNRRHECKNIYFQPKSFIWKVYFIIVRLQLLQYFLFRTCFSFLVVDVYKRWSLFHNMSSSDTKRGMQKSCADLVVPRSVGNASGLQ